MSAFIFWWANWVYERGDRGWALFFATMSGMTMCCVAFSLYYEVQIWCLKRRLKQLDQEMESLWREVE